MACAVLAIEASTALNAIIKQLVNRGATGDARSIQLLIGQIRAIESDLESSLP